MPFPYQPHGVIDATTLCNLHLSSVYASGTAQLGKAIVETVWA